MRQREEVQALLQVTNPLARRMVADTTNPSPLAEGEPMAENNWTIETTLTPDSILICEPNPRTDGPNVQMVAEVCRSLDDGTREAV